MILFVRKLWGWLWCQPVVLVGGDSPVVWYPNRKRLWEKAHRNAVKLMEKAPKKPLSGESLDFYGYEGLAEVSQDVPA